MSSLIKIVYSRVSAESGAESLDYTLKLDQQRQIKTWIVPTGLRMALRFPERISAIITQNGNAYVDGLSKDWAPVQTYWEKPTQENRDALRKLQTLETPAGSTTRA